MNTIDEWYTGCSKSSSLGLWNRTSAVLQPIKMKLHTMTDRDRRNLHPNFYNDHVIIDDVTVRFVIVKVLRSASLTTSFWIDGILYATQPCVDGIRLCGTKTEPEKYRFDEFWNSADLLGRIFVRASRSSATYLWLKFLQQNSALYPKWRH